MKQYDFTLRFRLKNPSDSAEKYMASLGENGCDDAIIGVGKPGRVSLNFTREADSALEAVTSAIENVKGAIPDAVLVESGPDFVGITDIAGFYGASRQYIRKLVLERAASFPDPVHEGNPSLWHLADVLDWVRKHEPERSNNTLFEVSELNRQINLYRSCMERKATCFPVSPSFVCNSEAEHLFRLAFGNALRNGTST